MEVTLRDNTRAAKLDLTTRIKDASGFASRQKCITEFVSSNSDKSNTFWAGLIAKLSTEESAAIPYLLLYLAPKLAKSQLGCTRIVDLWPTMTASESKEWIEAVLANDASRKAIVEKTLIISSFRAKAWTLKEALQELSKIPSSPRRVLRYNNRLKQIPKELLQLALRHDSRINAQMIKLLERLKRNQQAALIPFLQPKEMCTLVANEALNPQPKPLVALLVRQATAAQLQAIIEGLRTIWTEHLQTLEKDIETLRQPKSEEDVSWSTEEDDHIVDQEDEQGDLRSFFFDSSSSDGSSSASSIKRVNAQIGRTQALPTLLFVRNRFERLTRCNDNPASSDMEQLKTSRDAFQEVIQKTTDMVQTVETLRVEADLDKKSQNRRPVSQISDELAQGLFIENSVHLGLSQSTPRQGKFKTIPLTEAGLITDDCLQKLGLDTNTVKCDCQLREQIKWSLLTLANLANPSTDLTTEFQNIFNNDISRDHKQLHDYFKQTVGKIYRVKHSDQLTSLEKEVNKIEASATKLLPALGINNSLEDTVTDLVPKEFYSSSFIESLAPWDPQARNLLKRLLYCIIISRELSSIRWVQRFLLQDMLEPGSRRLSHKEYANYDTGKGSEAKERFAARKILDLIKDYRQEGLMSLSEILDRLRETCGEDVSAFQLLAHPCMRPRDLSLSDI